MNGRITRRIIIASGLFLAACQPLGDTGEVSARIAQPTAESRAALRRAVSDELHTPVRLADDALTRSNVLTIERNPPRNIKNLPTTGRVMGRPIHFRLVKNGEQCILLDERGSFRRVLENTTCVPW